jgi:threonyl-tRNA synthetase
MIYAAGQHSYRELPVRYNELAPMFRSERSGVLSGLSRVRQIDLDDTHVFCRPDQVAAEADLALRAVLEAFGVLGIAISSLRLSRRDGADGYLGSDRQWAQSEEQLREVLAGVNRDFADLPISEALGEAAFYGPKIDVQVRDIQGHEETLATVQLDFNQPERFDLHYVDADGSRQRVIMIHRGLMGAMERMIAFLLEIHDGRLPIWLAPVQIALLPVGPAHRRPVEEIAARLRRSALRVRVEDDGTLGHRIRSCRRRRDALIGVVGDAEIAADQVAVRDPRSEARAEMSVQDLRDAVTDAVASRDRSVPLGSPGPGTSPSYRPDRPSAG